MRDDISHLKEIEDGSFYYLASPFSDFARGHDAANRIICRVAARLMKARIPVFSPIAHSFAIAKHGDLDISHGFGWIAMDRPLMIAAHGLVIAKMTGWEDSVGVGEELDYFEAAGKPVEYIKVLAEDLK